MRWRRLDSPVRDVERAWIDEQLDWLVSQFGADRLHGEVILPTDGYFPGTYTGSRDDVRRVLERICGFMGVDRSRVVLEHYRGDGPRRDLEADIPLVSAAALRTVGHHRMDGEHSIVGIDDDQAASPTALVATIAHELGHVLLIGGGRITADREDHEPLTDLLTVFFGLGIFTANAAFEYGREVRGNYIYTRGGRLGYLTEPMYGYALARYAWLRDEERPAWAAHLDTNPRAFLRRGLRYLRQA
jgi:hypothetical protein